jgi:hypothetical protein
MSKRRAKDSLEGARTLGDWRSIVRTVIDLSGEKSIASELSGALHNAAELIIPLRRGDRPTVMIMEYVFLQLYMQRFDSLMEEANGFTKWKPSPNGPEIFGHAVGASAVDAAARFCNSVLKALGDCFPGMPAFDIDDLFGGGIRVPDDHAKAPKAESLDQWVKSAGQAINVFILPESIWPAQAIHRDLKIMRFKIGTEIDDNTQTCDRHHSRAAIDRVEKAIAKFGPDAKIATLQAACADNCNRGVRRSTVVAVRRAYRESGSRNGSHT